MKKSQHIESMIKGQTTILRWSVIALILTVCAGSLLLYLGNVHFDSAFITAGTAICSSISVVTFFYFIVNTHKQRTALVVLRNTMEDIEYYPDKFTKEEIMKTTDLYDQYLSRALKNSTSSLTINL